MNNLDRLKVPESVAYLSPEHAAACKWAVSEIERLERERGLLAAGIRDAAVKVGIISADTDLTGPHLLMLCNDLADSALHKTA